MSEKITNKVKEEYGEYKVPEFHNADWTDDIDTNFLEEKEEDNKMDFRLMGDEKAEVNYKSHEISKEAKERIKLSKIKQKQVGIKIFRLSSLA